MVDETCTGDADSNTEKIKQIQRKSRLKKRYGMTLENYEDLYKLQGKECAICKTKASSLSRYRKTLVVDHCHKTNKVRGLLCHICNVGLGHFKDDIMLLSKAMSYLMSKGVI